MIRLIPPSPWETLFSVTDTSRFERHVKRTVSAAVSESLNDLADLAISVIAYAGSGTDQPFVTPITFLDGEVRYQLECDYEQGIITESEHKKLALELNRVLAKARRHKRRQEGKTVKKEPIEERKRQYQKQIALITGEARQRMARFRGECKLVQEFGNVSEKHGINFGLIPAWARLD